MTEARDLLISALEEKRPLVLALGQDAWRENGREDPVLAKALAHLQREEDGRRGWLRLFGALPLTPDFYEWLAERFVRRVPPDWLTILGEVPWSAIFTSSLDPTLGEMFNKRQRPEPVLTNAEMPPAIRSRVRPPLYHLFGHAGTPDPRAHPPLDRNQFNTRRFSDASPLLGRMLDTTTRLGLVLIDGFVAGRDWLRIDDILGAIGNAGPNQVLWFKGCKTPLPDDEGFAAAVAANRVLVVKERLSTVITELRAVSRIADLMTPDPEEAGKVTFENGRVLETSAEERLHLEAVASVVDDAWTAPLSALGEDAEYAAFRRFHGEPGNVRSLVEGVRRGFAIERDYERNLVDQVLRAINYRVRLDAPIILHGQSATGKSIALARVVAQVREAKDAAVLYSNNRVPAAPEIADFCQKAEEAGAKATLLVCDTNQDVRPYFDLLSGLQSRGHRVVVVGSRYRFIDDEGNRLKSTVEAPTMLSHGERNALSALLRRFTDEQLPPADLGHDHILAFLYRALPLSRYRIGAGLGDEADRTERMVRDQRERYVVSRPPDTLMAQRLIEAGASEVFPKLFNEKQLLALDADNAAGRIIDLVMASGSLGCAVPFNLLLRLTADRHSSASPTDVAEMFAGLDLFRWEWADVEHNELLVMPRLTLEAELICRRRLGSEQSEAECVIDLISAIRSVGVDRDHELRFLFNVLRQVGPNGPRRNRYRGAYLDIAKTLTDLRTRFGVVHPSIVLRESAFRRYAVREEAVADEIKMTLLVEARDAVQTTINEIETGSISAPRRTQQFLKVELATLYGFIANSRAKAGRPNDEIWSTYLAAKSSVRQAVSATDSYFPLDVGLWTPADLLERHEMDDWQSAELTADIYDILDQIDPDALAPDQRERFEVRRLKIGDTLGNQELSETAFASLIERGSTAGYYLRARELAPKWDRQTKPFTSLGKDQARRAADFLIERMALIAQDQRCLSLLFECLWIAEVGRRPFIGQRQPLPATANARQSLLNIVTRLNEACGETVRNVNRYLAAVLMWTGGEEQAATEMFRELNRDTEFKDSSRVIRRHMMTDEHGLSRRFDGRVEEESKSGRSWTVRMESGSRQKVRLLSRDFPKYDIAYGRQVRGFGVAFNFIGPIATPIK